jgi:hypothetical protein
MKMTRHAIRTREIIERVVWALSFGVAMLPSVSAKAWDVEMHDGQWRLSVTPPAACHTSMASFRLELKP